ncbi:hypothetical protein [Microbacterium sp. PAMC21962]|uniref:hypothetical protein n=1 Tax=Microbacterium sp. PAMC21962 TaxID=2861280 RepID=UPI001C63B165|nr:hypothetical protein [Microbacterium sp. PAMC21962]QYF98110.1 hypothetical protein KY498_02315 [Microbacterium sp. PAMC21962]
MTAKHRDSEWRRTTRIIRAQVSQAWARGEDVACWRHGDLIPEGSSYDVGHISLHGGNTIDNAAPECRHGNRSHGGKIGARITNQRRRARTTGLVTPPWA